jgi:DNA invertase Pin-like site-specific DNA recombinase
MFQALDARPIRAARYMRMSTDQQKYSLEHQTLWIDSYAAEHGYEIVRDYVDGAKSGLYLKGRKALAALIADVVGGDSGFDVILVLDISRWGRFQDPDESACYEFLCRRAGVRVEYCAEEHVNGSDVVSAIIKQLKRGMAAEYSRDLSRKLARVGRELSAKGWRMSGSPGFALRRQVVDHQGRPGAILERGFKKAMKSGYIRLAPGPPEEVAVVRRIFRLYVITGMTAKAIAELLNGEGIAAEHGVDWTPHRVRGVLHNEKYVGVNVYGRTSSNLGWRTTRNDPSEWVVVEDAFEPLISKTLFADAARIRRERSVRGLTNDDMLERLRELLADEGFLTGKLINETSGLPCVALYRIRFGSLSVAYDLIGYKVRSSVGVKRRRALDSELLAALAALYKDYGRLSTGIINSAPGVPHTRAYLKRFGTLEEACRLVGYRSPHDLARQQDQHESFSRTRDGRYIIVRGRLWRATNPTLPADLRQRLVNELMDARRGVAAARRDNRRYEEVKAKKRVQRAKEGLGERGPVWWMDNAPDYNRRLLKNTPYADLEPERRSTAPPRRRGRFVKTTAVARHA